MKKRSLSNTWHSNTVLKTGASSSSSVPIAAAGTEPANKRPRVTNKPPKADFTRSDPVPQWLNDAASTFVNATPTLNWTGGFYSWGTWLDKLLSTYLWTHTFNPNHVINPSQRLPPWRALVQACRKSGQVCGGTAALSRAKSDLVLAIVNLVYRRGEQLRLREGSQKPASERDIMRRVRAVVTRQRRHETASLTLIRFLDLAFVFSAYKDCKLAKYYNNKDNAPNNNNDDNSNDDDDDDDNHTASSRQTHERRLYNDTQFRNDLLEIEHELLIFENRPTALNIRDITMKMQNLICKHRWLPWYEHIPRVRDHMVIHAREAAWSFCQGLPFPQLHIRAGVRGLSRDHISGAGSMNDWLVSLLDAKWISKWATLAQVYEKAVNEKLREEEALLEETSRRVVERVLEPLTEMNEGGDSHHSKLVDAAPGIVVTQSLRIHGRFTFRQILELYIQLSMFGSYLHSTFFNCLLPSIEEIHSGIMLFEEIKTRVIEVRPLIQADHIDRLFEWCTATSKSHPRDAQLSVSEYERSCKYQENAIRAALGPAITLLPGRKKMLEDDQFPITHSDPLVFAAVIAQWDAAMSARVIDASTRINETLRMKFESGRGGGLDLYTYRRVMVCQAACDRFKGDISKAAKVMSRLHPIWDVCVDDKGIGQFDGRGAMTLKMAVDKGNFEAASIFGLLLCAPDWEDRRKACDLELDIESGLAHICRAITLGDTASAADLLHILERCTSAENSSNDEDGIIDVDKAVQQHAKVKVPQQAIQDCLQCLKDASASEESLSLFLGYVYSQGLPGIPPDCAAAAKQYERVLLSNSTSTQYRAYAANNLGIITSFMSVCNSIGELRYDGRSNGTLDQDREKEFGVDVDKERDSYDATVPFSHRANNNLMNDPTFNAVQVSNNGSTNKVLNEHPYLKLPQPPPQSSLPPLQYYLSHLSHAPSPQLPHPPPPHQHHVQPQPQFQPQPQPQLQKGKQKQKQKQRQKQQLQDADQNSTDAVLLQGVDEMSPKDLLRLASRAGVTRAQSNLAAVLCYEKGKQIEGKEIGVDENPGSRNVADNGSIQRERVDRDNNDSNNDTTNNSKDCNVNNIATNNMKISNNDQSHYNPTNFIQVDEREDSLEEAKKLYAKLFKHTAEDSTASVVQTDYVNKVMRFSLVKVKYEQQEEFCENLQPSGMNIGQYGTVIREESIPITFASPSKSSKPSQQPLTVTNGDVGAVTNSPTNNIQNGQISGVHNDNVNKSAYFALLNPPVE